MTEAEWLTTKLPLYMLREYPGEWDKRKSRLFCCACLQRGWPFLQDKRTRRFIELAENNPEDSRGELASEYKAVRALFLRGNPESYFTHHPDFWVFNAFLDNTLPECLMYFVSQIAQRVAEGVAQSRYVEHGSSVWRKTFDEAEAAEKARQAELIREVFGNPFRPLKVDPSWLTSDVVALARGIYEEKAFDRMPILADALQDAGCDNVNVLDHCREAREHVRGCWVVDLVLGKE